MTPKASSTKFDLVDLSDDPWAAVQAATEQRLTFELQAKMKAEEQKRELRHERWEQIWMGVGYGGIILAILGAVLTVSWLVYANTQHDKANRLQVEQERTKQMQACVTLNEPIERQFCLVKIPNSSNPSR